MEFVEDHQTDAGQFRIGLDLAQENAFGDHFDAGIGTDFLVVTGAVTDLSAGLFPQHERHAPGRAIHRKAAGLDQQDFPLQPGLLQHGQRHFCGLARAGGRLHHHAGTVAALRQQGIQNLIDG